MMRGMISSGFMEGHGDVTFARCAYFDDDVSRLVESLAVDLSTSKAANNSSSLVSS